MLCFQNFGVIFGTNFVDYKKRNNFAVTISDGKTGMTGFDSV